MNKKRFKFFFTKVTTRTPLVTDRLKQSIILKKRVDIQAVRKTKRSTISIVDKIKQTLITIKVVYFPLSYKFLIKLKSLLLITMFLMILGIFVRWLLDPQTLPISAHIVGNQRVTNDELQQIIAPYLVGGFFHINLSAIQQVVSTIPWIKQVELQRIFPDTLLIKVKEHQPIARWYDNMVVDSEGEVFSGIELVESLPLFTASTTISAKSMLTYYQQLQPLLRTKHLQIKQFGCNTRRAWFMILENNIHLLLGHDNMHARLQRFIKVYDHFKSSLFSLCEQQGFTACTQQQDFIIHVDLRYTNGMAVRLTKAE